MKPLIEVLITWSSGKQTCAAFADEASAQAWADGRRAEIVRHGWAAVIELRSPGGLGAGAPQVEPRERDR